MIFLKYRSISKPARYGFATGLFLVAIVLFIETACVAQRQQFHTIKADNPDQLKDLFSYTPDRIPFVSAHRGGARRGFPENCIATFENTLRHTPAIMEVDPRLTKDGVIILMHDATLDRTTNGSGKVEDHTWEALKKFRLKDPEGNLTDTGFPLWMKGLRGRRTRPF
jgi:glycerophosphoryl diester phosphodiesterase